MARLGKRGNVYHAEKPLAAENICKLGTHRFQRAGVNSEPLADRVTCQDCMLEAARPQIGC